MLLAAFSGGAFAKDPPGLVHMSDEQRKTIGLQMATAERQQIAEPVRLPGVVTFDPGHVAVLRPFAQARVLRLLVQPGDSVAAGQPVAELDMPMLAESEQNVFAAGAAVHEAEAAVAVAAAALHRGEILARDGSLARAEADRRRLVLAQAVASADTARARAAMLQAEVARLSPMGAAGVAALKAPIAGTVSAVSVTPGEVLDAARDTLTVADLSVVLVLAEVPEAQASIIAVGDAADVTLPGGGGRHWSGKVSTLAAELDRQARTLPARIQIANPDHALRAGMSVDVTVTRALGRASVVVPSAAVQMIGDKRVVFTPAGGDGFLSHDVEVGVQRQETVELRRGIEAGAQVVTQGSFALRALLQQSMLNGD
jgi:cobalt-zinc-cadmium efflux system membrane fusion protein